MHFTIKQVVDMITEEDWDLGADVICEGSDNEFSFEDEDYLSQDKENDTNNIYMCTCNQPKIIHVQWNL